jgi:hypothetical protein
MKPMEYEVRIALDLPFPCALTRTKDALLQHGMSVVSETAIDSPRTVIFSLEHPIGEVVVYEDECGGVTVVAMGGEEAGEPLDAVLDWLRPCASV